jgi:hypothetical protein
MRCHIKRTMKSQRYFRSKFRSGGVGCALTALCKPIASANDIGCQRDLSQQWIACFGFFWQSRNPVAINSPNQVLVAYTKVLTGPKSNWLWGINQSSESGNIKCICSCKQTLNIKLLLVPNISRSKLLLLSLMPKFSSQIQKCKANRKCLNPFVCTHTSKQMIMLSVSSSAH